MKKYPSMFGVLAALLLVASFIVPGHLVTPSSVEADPGMAKWDALTTPGVSIGRWDLGYFPALAALGRAGTDTIDLAVGGDGNTIAIVTRTGATSSTLGYPVANILLVSSNNGISFSAAQWTNWTIEWNRLFGTTDTWNGENIYLVAIAPDNPAVMAIVTDAPDATLDVGSGPQEVWITTNGGGKWEVTNLRSILEDQDEYIRCISISVDYGGRRDIAVGTVDGSGEGDVYVLKSTGFTGWIKQNFDDIPLGDFQAIKFSPSYASDGALVVVYSDDEATYYNISLRDIDRNTHRAFAFTTPVEVKDPSSPALASPGVDELNRADLELPSDFSGAAASLRRAYISLDAWGSKAIDDCEDGIFRIDDTTVYTLMNTTNTDNKAIYSIAYYGTFASGKLLAGERLGDPCAATVPTWFTDAPTTCPIPCWYPALKPTTGAACLESSAGGALVAWRADGQLAFAATGALLQVPSADWYTNFDTNMPVGLDESAFAVSRNNGETWNQIAVIDTMISQFTDVAPSADCKTIYLASVNRGTIVAAPVYFDVTCNGGTASASFNGTATLAAWRAGYGCNVTDVSLSPSSFTGTYKTDTCSCSIPVSATLTYTCACGTDTCPVSKTATVSGTLSAGCKAGTQSKSLTVACSCCAACGNCATECVSTCAFDSVWRTSANPQVVAPYPALSVGTFWERVFTHVTALDCRQQQSDLALLRLVPYCQDETGQLVAWAAQGTKAAFWSPDYGDYWAQVTPRNDIQDFCFESKTVMYFLSPTGLVQKMPYTGTAWATTLSDVNSWMTSAHTIAAYPEGKVLVGAGSAYHATAYAASLSQNFNTDNPSFAVLSTLLRSPYGGNVHVAFDPNFKDNKTFFLADDNALGLGGSVYRATPGPLGTGNARLSDLDMMADSNGAVGCNAPHPVGQYGIVLAQTGQALYSAHTSSGDIGCGVDRTIAEDAAGHMGPLSGMPKPGIAWDCLNVFVSPPAGRVPCFTLEPSSLKICGCCTLDSDSTLYAIDNAAYVPNAYYPGYATAFRSGFVWGFTDCFAKKGPKLVTDDKALIGCDPVSGRAAEVNLCWEQLCVARAYDIEVAKNSDFTLLVVDVASEDECDGFQPADVTKPCAYIPAGGITMSGSTLGLTIHGNLECGHTYYWRVKVREAATGQWIRSPWSEVRSFTVKAGVPVSAPYQGLQPLAPANGAVGVGIDKPCFSWAPMGDVKTYEFTLMEGATVVKTAQVSGTSYCYDGKLKYNTSYTWKVKPLDPPGDPSPSFVFKTETEPAPPPPPEKPAPTPLWVWVVIAIGAILVIVTLVLIFKTRRV